MSFSSARITHTITFEILPTFTNPTNCILDSPRIASLHNLDNLILTMSTSVSSTQHKSTINQQEASVLVKSIVTPASVDQLPPKGYSYTSKGLLVLNGYAFTKNMIKGKKNIIYWRCADARKFQCKAVLSTVGKELHIVKDVHTHESRKVEMFRPKVWNECND